MSRIKTGVLIAILTALLCLVGYGLAGDIGMLAAFLVSACIHLSAYWWGDVLVLRLYDAQKLDGANEPELFVIVQALAQTAQIPMPRIYVIPDSTPNACVVGRGPQHAALAVTTGLLDLFDRDELTGVIAHELVHIKNRDILIMTVVATLTGTLSRLADINAWRALLGYRHNTHKLTSQDVLNRSVSSLAAPISAALVQLTISRTQDFCADDMGAWLTGEPQALARALGKLERWNRSTPMQSGYPATSHLFIVSPCSQGTWARLFGTHPLTSDRIAYLEALMRLQDRDN